MGTLSKFKSFCKGLAAASAAIAVAAVGLALTAVAIYVTGGALAPLAPAALYTTFKQTEKLFKSAMSNFKDAFPDVAKKDEVNNRTYLKLGPT